MFNFVVFGKFPMTHNVKLVVALSTGRSSSVLVLYWQFRNLAKTALLILHLHAFFHPTFSSSWSQAPVALCLLSGPFHRCCEAPKPRERTYKSPHTRSCQALLTKTCRVLFCSWEHGKVEASDDECHNDEKLLVSETRMEASFCPSEVCLRESSCCSALQTRPTCAA